MGYSCDGPLSESTCGKYPRRLWSAFFFLRVQTFLAAGFLCCLPTLARGGLWSTGYYPGYRQSSVPASNIDFTAVSHVIHFSLVPNSDGSLNSSANNLTSANSADVISRAHAAGKEVLICVGGADTELDFQAATSSTNLSSFINNLTNFMASRGYDGVDVDWEPLPASDAEQYTNLVNELRSALDAFPQHKLLTAAAGAYPPYGDPAAAEGAMYASLQGQFDQINLMTYDLSGPYPGWVTWFNSPIYDGGYQFPSTGGLVPSVDGAVNYFLTSGVAAAKLGIGIPFYGDIWQGGAGTSTGGVTQPRQSWTTAPSLIQSSYNTIINQYYQPQLYYWDTNAQAAYLSITNASAANDMFISYDDPHTCQAKVSYARNHGLGGVMIWELSQDYNASAPVGQRDPLLQTIKQAFATPRITGASVDSQGVNISFTSLPLAFYRVQWTSNLTANLWYTLTNNVPGTGGILQVTDPDSTNHTQRFYRIQTPP